MFCGIVPPTSYAPVHPVRLVHMHDTINVAEQNDYSPRHTSIARRCEYQRGLQYRTTYLKGAMASHIITQRVSVIRINYSLAVLKFLFCRNTKYSCLNPPLPAHGLQFIMVTPGLMVPLGYRATLASRLQLGYQDYICPRQYPAMGRYTQRTQHYY